METAYLVEMVKSCIVHIVYVKDTNRIIGILFFGFSSKKVDSDTGFILHGYLVTNQHVVQTPDDMRQGEDIVLLGYPLEHNNLVVHKGIISSL